MSLSKRVGEARCSRTVCREGQNAAIDTEYLQFEEGIIGQTMCLSRSIKYTQEEEVYCTQLLRYLCPGTHVGL